MTATSQLALCFDFEPPQTKRRKPRQLGAPYHPFDDAEARRTILECLHKAGGEWVRRRKLHRATGMHPQHTGGVIDDLVRGGTIEEMDVHFGSNHPAITGYLGQTCDYRIAQEGAQE